MDNKLTFFALSLLLIGTILGSLAGYGFYPILNKDLGAGVRGGAVTGFEVIDGDSISIATSSPNHELEIYNTATGTIMIDGSAGCLIIKDTDNAGYTYNTFLNGVITSSSTDICNN